MVRSKKPCIFFRDGRCRYGNNCNFAHTVPPTARPARGLPPSTFATPSHLASSSSMTINKYSNPATWPSQSRPLRVYESGAVDAGQEPLGGKNKFFEILQAAVCHLDEEELESATEALRDQLPTDYRSENDSDPDNDSSYGCGDSDDEDFGDLDLFSPLKKSTPEYREPTFSTRQTAHYARNSYSHENNVRRETFFDWDLLDNPSVFNVHFGANFSIEDSHIAGFSARPDLCRRLQRFAAGDTDTGNGGAVRNEAAFIQFVQFCSSMRVFRLEAFTSLSDATLSAIFEACPRIEMIQLTGHDKSHGKVTGTALKKLAKTPSWAPNLQALYLLDQTHKLDASVKVLSAARPRLWIFTGETLGNSMSAQMLAATPGGEADTHTWLGGKIVSIGSDCGIYA
ncbi:hypothetical protein FB451DRAFT_1222078 [Mycena latifolia]|nr:hypothetical protein FB451DRAFT_1222078 [Mycena latifolia]